MKQKKKKVLFVINTLGTAGAEKALLALLDNIDYDSYEVSLFVMMNQGVLWKEISKEVRVLNKNYYEETVFSPKGRLLLARTVMKASLRRGTLFRSLPYLFSNFVDLAKQKKVNIEKLLWKVVADGAPRIHGNYDLAVAYLEGASTYYVANHVNAKKKAAFVHVDYGLAGYTRKLDNNCYAQYDRIFPISEEVETSFFKMYPEYQSKVKVFHNIVNTRNILKRADEEGGFSDHYTGTRLLTVGRLTEQKAYDVAIDAMHLLKQDGYDVRWYVLGEGICRSALEKQIKSYGLEKDFLLLGTKENPYPYYKQTDIYVHATKFEGKSIAIQEAQVLGCVILASNCSGNRDQVVSGVDGVLCELSAVKIKEAIVALIQQKEKWKAMGEAARNRQRDYKEDMKLLYDLAEESNC